MPSQRPSYGEIQKTNQNQNKNIKDAVVVANYGDPGLDEDYQSDVLSRYVICMLDSVNRNLTAQKAARMLILVERPQELWIKYQDGFKEDLSLLRRSDFALNTNVGPAGAYTVDTIPRINYPYRLGEKIKVKLVDPKRFLNSECPWNATQNSYSSWHNQGLAGLDFYPEGTNINFFLRRKTIYPIGSNEYVPVIHKLQYEALVMSLYNDIEIKKLFLGDSDSYDGFYYRGNGGYVFNFAAYFALSNSCFYQDINAGGKARIPTNTCLPLVVTSPNSFTVPQTRAIGTVNYNPVYVPRS